MAVRLSSRGPRLLLHPATWALPRFWAQPCVRRAATVKAPLLRTMDDRDSEGRGLAFAWLLLFLQKPLFTLLETRRVVVMHVCPADCSVALRGAAWPGLGGLL